MSLSKPKRSLLSKIGYFIVSVGLVLIVVLLAFRYFGLPSQIGDQLVEELDSRGLGIGFERLYLDPLARVVARGVVLRQASPAAPNSLTVDEVRLRFNWISWWRGEPFLEKVMVRGGELKFPFSEEQVVHFEDVELDSRLTSEGIVVDRARAKILNCELTVKGALNLIGIQTGEKKPPTLEDMRERARIWEQIVYWSEQFSTEERIQIALEADWILARPEESELKFSIEATDVIWNGVVFDTLYTDAYWQDGAVRMEGGVDLLRGGMNWQGNWLSTQTKARINLFSDVDLSLLAPAVPEAVSRVLTKARFRTLPINEGEVTLDWTDEFNYLLRLRSLWEQFSIGDSRFDHLMIPLAYDGKRIIVSDMELKNDSGRAVINFFYDGDDEVRADMDSTLDLTDLKPIAPEAAHAFINSLDFQEGGPAIRCQMKGEDFSMETIFIEGDAEVENFSYKDVDLEYLKTSFSFSEGAIYLPNLYIRREEGEGTGEVWHSFTDKLVRIKNVKAQLNLKRTARIIGDKMEEYAQPYGFFEAPYCEAEGQVDLKGCAYSSILSPMILAVLFRLSCALTFLIRT
ncbi:MAG: hypothetical protein AAFY98_06690, partial [Verrucomicrobiota bacterium]